jgi:transaldolase
MNPLQQIGKLGQAIWLDDIHRSLMTSGDLKVLIDDDGLCGMTSNPTIFDKAIAGSHDYDDDIRALALEGKGVNDIFEALAIKDVQMAADTFRPLYDRTNGRHGFVSLEVSPHLAHDTEGTLADARRLWAALDRPNVFIKVPATLAGLPAIRQLTSDGINVNITLLFGLPRYRQVAEAYIAGIEERLARGQDVRNVRSVASFFLSRIDVVVDPLLERIRKEGGTNTDLAASLLGQTAIASAKQAYQIYKEISRSDRWKKLADSGAWPQWLLWASTSTKNSQYSDVMYVDSLIGPETVNTLPTQTLDAYRDHGDPKPRLEDDVDNARRVLESLSKLDIDIDKITQQLEDEGIEKFSTSLNKLLETLTGEVDAVRNIERDHIDSTIPTST